MAYRAPDEWSTGPAPCQPHAGHMCNWCPSSKIGRTLSRVLSFSPVHTTDQHHQAPETHLRFPNARRGNMPRSRANPPEKPKPSNEAQDGTQAGHGNDADGDDAESVRSDVTVMPPTETLLDEAQDLRQRKNSFAGKPTRPIREFSADHQIARFTSWHFSPTHDQLFFTTALKRGVTFSTNSRPESRS